MFLCCVEGLSRFRSKLDFYEFSKLLQNWFSKSTKFPFINIIGDMWSPGSSIREILEEQYYSFPEDVRSHSFN